MTKRARRTMSVADLLILVVTAGIGIGCLLAVDRTLGSSLTNPLRRTSVLDWLAVGWHPAKWLILLKEQIPIVLPLLGGWAAVLPLLRLRDPWPRRRRSFGQPGIVACLAAWAGAAWGGLAMVITFGLSQTQPGVNVTNWGSMGAFRSWACEFLALQMMGMAGLAVAAAWLGVALAGRWRRPEDWIDRLGRILGWGWIGAGFVWALGAYYHYMI
jgi:hypothetical protein